VDATWSPTMGKSNLKDTEHMTTQQQRTLQGFGKWMQDQERPLRGGSKLITQIWSVELDIPFY